MNAVRTFYLGLLCACLILAQNDPKNEPKHQQSNGSAQTDAASKEDTGSKEETVEKSANTDAGGTASADPSEAQGPTASQAKPPQSGPKPAAPKPAAGAKPAAAPKPPPPSEVNKAIDEFRTQTQNLGLRSDSPLKTALNGSTKPKWHGRVFENFRNNFLDAVPHEIVQRGGVKGLLQRNQYGFNLSGPVWIPRLYNGSKTTFFSLTFEGVREKIARTSLRTIPTMLERNGDWDHVVDAAGQQLRIFDPQSTSPNPAYNPAEPVSEENLQYNRLPFPGNRIPVSRLDPVAQRALTLYPAPNADAGPFYRNNYFINSAELNKAGGVIARIDHNLKDGHRIGGGLNYSNGRDGAAPWFLNVANPGPVARDRRTRRLTLEHVYTASARNVNTFTADASRDQFVNAPELDENGKPYPQYRLGPYVPMGRSYPVSSNARNTFTFTDSFATRWREHRFRLIGQVAREQVNTLWPKYPNGSYQFGSGLTSLPGIVNTGHAFASFLLGAAEYAETSVVTAPSYFRKSRFLVAVRDQWEIRKGLSLSFGLNWEGSTPRVERYDRMSTVSMSEINPVNGRPGALIVAGLGGRSRGFQPFLNKAEPSASLAWNILGSQRTVMRASYGRSYSGIPIYSGQWGTQAFNGNPTWVSLNPQLVPALTLASGYPPGARTFPNTSPDAVNNTVADLVDPNGHQPTYNSVGLSLERELRGSVILTLGAAHADGRNLLLSNSGSNPNAIPLSALEYRDRLNDENFNRSLRPFPQYQRFDVYSSWPEGRYKRDVGYLRVEKRTSGGLSMSAYYELSKQMDNYSGPYGVQDFYNRQNEWSLTSSNNPQRLSLSVMYELPLAGSKGVFSVSGWPRYMLEGWSVSGVTTVVSGEPIALRPQFNNTGGVVDVLTVDPVPGVDPEISNRGPDQWFNPSAFATPADFAIGTLSRTHPTLRNPGSQNHDLSLIKRLPLNSEQSLELSAVGLNFVNHANWSEPDPIIGPASAPNVNAGKIIGSRGGRVIQVGLRYSF